MAKCDYIRLAARAQTRKYFFYVCPGKKVKQLYAVYVMRSKNSNFIWKTAENLRDFIDSGNWFILEQGRKMTDVGGKVSCPGKVRRKDEIILERKLESFVRI